MAGRDEQAGVEPVVRDPRQGAVLQPVQPGVDGMDLDEGLGDVGIEPRGASRCAGAQSVSPRM